MEQKITDSLGNEITIVYDETTDTLTVNNPAVDAEFHEVRRMDSCKPDMVIEIEGTHGEGSWEAWSDEEVRNIVVTAWEENKKDKE